LNIAARKEVEKVETSNTTTTVSGRKAPAKRYRLVDAFENRMERRYIH
jgi:hypothetical protein